MLYDSVERHRDLQLLRARSSTNSTSIMKGAAVVLCLALLVVMAWAEDANPLVIGCNQVCGKMCDISHYINTKMVPFLGEILTTLDTLCDQMCGLACGIFAM
ncbi:hypothetical protein RRG08_009124 [Elysia crispata]|uniref:Uncharacterized protein n=1 Tax=Elysia crispata TaxID=231223 RepID=A0AAE1D2V5_9GAST|nr:hypothetical protein RRG08_009124 [Elysia crispata]